MTKEKKEKKGLERVVDESEFLLFIKNQQKEYLGSIAQYQNLYNQLDQTKYDIEDLKSLGYRIIYSYSEENKNYFYRAEKKKVGFL